MSKEWIEYDSAGYPHKKREQPAPGEPSQCPDMAEQINDVIDEFCDSLPVPTQPEAGEKPQCCQDCYWTHVNQAEGINKAECNCPCHRVEPSSPLAQAGGAREWLKEHSAVFTGMDDIEYVAGHMERYAAQVSKSEREARERAEGALRLTLDMLEANPKPGFRKWREAVDAAEEALAALKSSQEEGKL